MGILSDAIQKLYGFRTRSNINPEVSTVGTTAVLIAKNNPDRVGLTIINLSVNNMYISPVSGVSSTKGIEVPSNGGSVSMNFRDDGELPGFNFYAVASAAGSGIYVLETIGE